MPNALTTDDVLAEMLAWLRAEIPAEGVEIGPDTQVIADSLIDSMDLLRLVSHLENRYTIAIDPALIVPERFATPRAVAELVCEIAERG